MANIEWSKIKKCINLYTKNSYSELNISVHDNEINSNIDLLYNIITKRLGMAFLDGWDREILPALQNSCIDRIGSINDFRTIKTSVDVLLKRLLVLTGSSYSDVCEKGTKALFIHTGVHPSYTMSEPKITKAVVDGYKNTNGPLFLFTHAAFCRNEVHESPDYDASQVTSALKYILAFYVYMVGAMRERVLQYHPEYKDDSIFKIGDVQGERMYYDFMNYGHEAIALKNRIINSFVFDQLYQADNEKDKLIGKMVTFSRGSLKSQSATRIIDRLVANSRVFVSPSNVVSLAPLEKERLTQAYSNYSERINDLTQKLEVINEEYNLTCSAADLLNVIKTFFENNFNSDLIDLNDDIDVANVDELQVLISTLTRFGCEQAKINLVISSILQICKDNDILIRLGMGKLFSKISNPDSFEKYSSLSQRRVYLDTQILLYAMCANLDYGNWDNIRYASVRNLFSAVNSTANAELIFCSHYIPEISFHLRQALLLIPFADRYNHYKHKISANVFYQFYYDMRENNQLPEGVETFGDFLEQAFDLYEEDAFDQYYWKTANSIVRDIISSDLGITITEETYFGEDDVTCSSGIFKLVCSTDRPKSGSILKNDAIMGLVLFEHSIDEPDPFFITWDSAFSSYRKKYIERIKRKKHIYWHLFSPSRFVNHIDLLNFKIDVNSISDDLLSVIEADEYKNHTSHIIDKFEKVVDISGIDPQKRRRYMLYLADEVLSEKEYTNTVESETGESQKAAEKIASIFDAVLEYYKETGDDQLKKYINNILDEAFFERLVNVVMKYAVDNDLGYSVTEIIGQVDSLSEEMFGNVAETTNESI